MAFDQDRVVVQNMALVSRRTATTDEFSADVPMALGTNNLTVLTERTLRWCGVSEKFETTICSDLPGISPKLSPEIYLKRISELGQFAGGCCILEDNVAKMVGVSRNTT